MGIGNDSLRRSLTALGLSDNESRVVLLEKYLSELELWNPRYKMIADTDNLVTRHLADSLAALPLLRALDPKTIADIGSGAGLPGIPLAIWLEDCAITLVERSGRRAGFLRNVVLSLGLSRISIEEKPLEQLTGQFDLITVRAYTTHDGELLDSMEKIMAHGGVIAAYKGRRQTIDEELSSVSGRLSHLDVRALEVPGLNEERHLVIMRLPVSRPRREHSRRSI